MAVPKLHVPDHLMTYKIPWGPIGEPVYRRSYCHDFDDGTKETWPHTVIRAVDGNLGLVPAEFIEEGEREKLIELLMPFGIVPGGRHLFASGVKGRQFLFNCHASGWDAQDPSLHFTFLFDQLMMGGGVGANYSNRYLDTMPPISSIVDLTIICRDDHPNIDEFRRFCTLKSQSAYLFADGEIPVIEVEDSREGWVKALGEVTERSFKSTGISKLIVDVSKIRHRGAPLKTSGGIACGPQPLVEMLMNVTAYLNRCYGTRMTSEDAMLIDHSCADCVQAGGKRRSSRMSVKSWKDHDIFRFLMLKQKDGDHWTTNISVEIDDEFIEAYKAGDPHARLVHKLVVLGKRKNGEPGYWNISLARRGEKNPELVYCPNPCGEICLYMWENCNLGHTFMGYFANKPLKAMLEAHRLMTRWLVRATNGDITQPRQKEVVLRNRRIGVGFFGFHEWLAMHGIKYSECWRHQFVRDTLKKMRSVADEEADRYSDQLGQPRPVKRTALAPTGTGSALPGATGSGQCMMAPWYKRLVRYAKNSDEVNIKKMEGYEVFDDPDAKNTEIVVFWCEDPLVAKVRATGMNPADVLEGQYDISMRDSLEIQKMFQEIYADNAVSFTINVKPDTMPPQEEMERLFMEYLPFIKGTTVFPDKSRRNAPIQPITEEEFVAYQGQKEIAYVEVECVGACPIK